MSSLKHLTLLSLANSRVWGQATVRQLVTSLVHLTNLKSLDLYGCLRRKLANAAKYAAVAASAQLESLNLAECLLHSKASEHVFSAHNPRTALTELRAGSNLFSRMFSFQRMVASCPALQHLELVTLKTSHHPCKLDLQVSWFVSLNCPCVIVAAEYFWMCLQTARSP